VTGAEPTADCSLAATIGILDTACATGGPPTPTNAPRQPAEAEVEEPCPGDPGELLVSMRDTWASADLDVVVARFKRSKSITVPADTHDPATKETVYEIYRLKNQALVMQEFMGDDPERMEIVRKAIDRER
jgi:hypothetical protein